MSANSHVVPSWKNWGKELLLTFRLVSLNVPVQWANVPGAHCYEVLHPLQHCQECLESVHGHWHRLKPEEGWQASLNWHWWPQGLCESQNWGEPIGHHQGLGQGVLHAWDDKEKLSEEGSGPQELVEETVQLLTCARGDERREWGKVTMNFPKCEPAGKILTFWLPCGQIHQQKEYQILGHIQQGHRPLCEVRRDVQISCKGHDAELHWKGQNSIPSKQDWWKPPQALIEVHPCHQGHAYTEARESLSVNFVR